MQRALLSYFFENESGKRKESGTRLPPLLDASLPQLLNSMSIHETDRTSTLDAGQDDTIIREDAGAESQRIGGDDERGQNPGVESDEAEEEEQAPAAAPPTSAGAKKIFGTMRRPNPTAKKGVKNPSCIMCRISWGAK